MTGLGLVGRALLLGLLLASLSRPARGEDTLGSGGRPWQVGVSAERRAAAEQAFAAGNREFEQSDYAAAAARYRQALASWAHPSIQFNLAVCLIYLDKPVEAVDLLGAAVRYGRDGLRDHFEEANNYLRLLHDRISILEVTLPEGAQVTLDGGPLEPAAGSAVVRRRLTPGRHSLVARKARYELWSKDLMLMPGETTREVIELRLPRTKTVRRWSAGQPWWVLGGGALVTALGAGAWLTGRADLRRADTDFGRRCPLGCSEVPDDLADAYDRGELWQYGGGGLALAGGATVLAGVVLLVLNQPRQVLDNPGVAVRVSPDHLELGWGHVF